jgi:hypothetical protein
LTAAGAGEVIVVVEASLRFDFAMSKGFIRFQEKNENNFGSRVPLPQRHYTLRFY